MAEFRKDVTTWGPTYLPLFLLSLLCVLLYLPSLYHDFVFDDGSLVVENPYIKSWKYLPQMLGKDAWNIWDPGNYWRPVFSISLALDYSLWGLNPLGFHLTNILLHAINTVLLFSLGKKLQNTACAVFASLLFAVHPIQAHAVSVISTMRADLLAACFALLSLDAFFSRRTILFSVALMLALLSKETSIVFPVAILFACIMMEKKKPDLRLILAFIILGIYFAVRLSLGFSFSMIPLVFSYEASLGTRWLLAFKVLALYFFAIFNLFAMPHPLWTMDLPAFLNDPYVISGVSIFLLLLGAIWRNSKKNPIMAFGLMWFVIYFLPISNLMQLNTPMAEHWLYMPMIGLSLAFGAAVSTFNVRFSQTKPAVAGMTAGICLFLIFAALVVREKTKVYRNNEAFLIAAIRANPRIARLYSILASTYLLKQDIPSAIEFYTKALSLDPNELSANYMLGRLLYQNGQREKAKSHLERVVQIKPGRVWELLPVAHAWEMLGDKRKALFYYRRALERNPASAWVKERIADIEKQPLP